MTQDESDVFMDARYTVTRSAVTWVSLERATALGMIGPYQRMVLGPRMVGGVYRNAYWSDTYQVTSVVCGYRYVTRKYWGADEPVTELDSVGVYLECKWSDGHTTRHCTSWDERDTIISQPPLPVRLVTRTPEVAVRLKFVPFGPNHDCSLCRPGLIGKVEKHYRRGMVNLDEVMSDAFWVGQHHKNISEGPGVSLSKPTDPIIAALYTKWDGRL